ncbi:hypothetical protein NVP1176O_46 [Vibrio phage 1.176.O._10N.261.55.F5]|nr:hypothetical protein NVP1131O_46 [Vibrio phage 1.131.O._10N.222.49.A8]AUR92748.1 hypothetical protein NVP1176O_46 [Vibrio phage 1.176.O._10N.261.55.F5]
MSLMTFKFSKFHSDYLRTIVKGSGMTMTSYLEMLIDEQVCAERSEFSVALVLQGDTLKFVHVDEFPQMIVNSVTGEPVRAVITDQQSPEIISAFKLIMSSDLCESKININTDGTLTQKSKLHLTCGEAAEGMLGSFFRFDIKEAIFK